MFTIIVALVLGGIVWLYSRFRASLDYFSSRYVRHLPALPLVGNMGPMLLRKEHPTRAQAKLYHAFPNDRFVGYYEFTKPVLYIRDPELLRNIFLKDFDSFSLRRDFGVQDDDVFLSKGLVALKGQRWRDMRSTLSPAFTGSKLRGMVSFMQDCSSNMISHLRAQLEKNKDGYIDLDVKDLCSRYSNDVIASCAFGLKVDSVKEDHNEFHEMGKELTTIKLSSVIIGQVLRAIPFLKKKKSSQSSSKSVAFLRQIIYSSMRDREAKNIIRPDMIQLLLEAKKGTLKHENIKDEKDAGFATVEESEIGKGVIKQEWDDEDLFAQTLLFFFAGFDTVSSAMAFTLHELAINPEVQSRLQREVDETYEVYQGKLDYDKIQQMKYLDMVISETLRKWPPSTAGFRTCTKKYNLGKAHDSAAKDFIVEPGTLLTIPTWAIHRDPKFWPEPEKFNPERFSDENKHKIKPCTYLPFGMGPRNCIGSRFALIELKAMLADLIRYIEVVPAPNTAVDCKLDDKNFRTVLYGGHWLRLKLRN